MSRLNKNCAFCINNDIETEIETNSSIICTKCSFERDSVFNFTSSNLVIKNQIKYNHFGEILFNLHIPTNIIEEIENYFIKFKYKIKGNINYNYLYAFITEKILNKYNCPRTKEEIIYIFNLDKKVALKHFFKLNKYLSFKPILENNYSSVLYRIFDEKEFFNIPKFLKNKIYDIIFTLEKSKKNFVNNFKILIILICIYILKSNNLLSNFIFKKLLCFLDINKQTINKYIKKNTIKSLINIYLEIKKTKN